MSEALPLWNEDESEVLPPYQFSYGHVIVKGAMDEARCRRLFRMLKLGRPTSVEVLQPSEVPISGDGAYPAFTSCKGCHFVVSQGRGSTCVFGPHSYFLSSGRWVRWNRKTGGLFVFVTQDEENTFSYRVFRSGVKQTNAFAIDRQIQFVADPAIDVHLDGKRVYSEKTGLSEVDEAYSNIVRNDLELHYSCQDGLLVRPRFLSVAEDSPLIVSTHYRFKLGRGQSRD